MDNSMEIQDIRTRLEQFQANKDPRLKIQCQCRRCAGCLD